MKELDLGRILKQMYHQGRKRQESLIMLYLFGIKYGRFIMDKSYLLVIFYVMQIYRIVIRLKLKEGLYLVSM